MKNKRSRLGLSILAGGLSFVGAAGATDLIVNGSFELPSNGSWNYGGHCGGFSGNLCTGGSSTCAQALGWQSFSQYNLYSNVYYTGPAIPASENPGNYYSFRQAAGWSEWTHFITPQSESGFLDLNMPQYAASETVTLTDAVLASDIDATNAQYTFSAWLASYGTPNAYPEQPFLVLQFFSYLSNQPAGFISTAAIFDRTTSYPYAFTYADTNLGTNIPLDLSSDHQWIKYIATGSIPAGARQATVFITRSPNASTGGTDAGGAPSAQTYVDLVKLDVTGVTPYVAPPSQTAAVGNPATFSVAVSGGTNVTYQWRQNGTTLPNGTNSALYLPAVQMSNAGAYDVVVTSSAGSVISTPAGMLTVINPQVSVTGQWDFLQGNLAATSGADLQYWTNIPTSTNGPAVTSFGTTASFGIPGINGVSTPVMHILPIVSATATNWGGYELFHQAAPNGGGTNVNAYTLIYDVYYPAGSDYTWRTLWNGVGFSSYDGSLWIDSGDSIGFNIYDEGFVTAGAWHRLAFALDLTGTETGTATTPLLTKFIDGVKISNEILPSDGVDGQWSVGPYGLLFIDPWGDVAETYVSSVQFSNGRRADGFIEALGGPSALKIPGLINAGLVNGAVTITWSGGVPLQSADSLAGPWTTVAGTAGTNTYTPSALSAAQFYCPQIP